MSLRTLFVWVVIILIAGAILVGLGEVFGPEGALLVIAGVAWCIYIFRRQ